MKTTINRAATFTVRITIIFLLTLAAPLITFAQDFPGDLRLLTTTVKGQPVFQLNLYNNDTEKYFLEVKDGNGNVLYNETMAGSNLSTKYLLDIDEAEFNDKDFELRFEVTSAKSRQKQVYTVKRNDVIVKNIAIAKL